MFINRTVRRCYSSKLWNSATPFQSTTVNFTNLACHSNISTLQSIPKPIYTITRNSASTFLQKVSHRSLSVTPSNQNMPLDHLHIANYQDDNVSQWYPPFSSTERGENPAYTYLKNHADYRNLFFQQEKYSSLMKIDGSLTDEGEKQVNPALRSFIDLCNTQPEEFITDPKYEPIVRELITQSAQLNDEEILLFFFNLRRFSKRPKKNDKNYKAIWQPFDNLCLLRVQQKEWNSNLEYMFSLADLLYRVGLSSESKFHWDLFKRLYRKVDHLSKELLIRMMFCLGTVKTLPDTMSIYNIEYNLPKFIDKLSSAEVAVICMGYLRTKTSVHNKDVLRKILQIAAHDAKNVPSASVHAICKTIIISKSQTSSVEEDIYSFLDAFAPQIARLDMQACSSLMLMGLQTRVKHEGLCNEIMKKLEGKVEWVRSKDLEHICNTLASFGIECGQFFGEVVEDLRRKIGIMSTKEFSSVYGKSFVQILVNLFMRNIYPVDLISFGLSEDFLRSAFGSSMYTYTQEVAYLDICTGIEAVDYNGPRLSEKRVGFLTKKNMLWIAEEEKTTLSDYQKIARSMLEHCVDPLGGPEFCHLCNLVPPFRTIGVVYGLRESDNNPVPFPEKFSKIEEFKIKYVPEPDKEAAVKFHAFILFPGSQLTANTREPMGMAVMHCRQMEKLGFHVYPIYLGHTVRNPTEMKQFVSKVLGRPIPEEPKID
ncbi:FAST kinase domain-containing protein 5 [Orchesella cincta]|uniref:FAST kinase domain-containing protein 5 n=1 Tax=Orchesella cincta TaxID=48709 RepID=A0A1D2MHQ7_ORCCI|nr:FAST kinase domain-containing protein 5 [Orchesella cincta]